jgi:hypothetical protein
MLRREKIYEVLFKEQCREISTRNSKKPRFNFWKFTRNKNLDETAGTTTKPLQKCQS